MKSFVLALSLFATPVLAGELCKLDPMTDGDGNNVCAPSHELGASGPIAGGFELGAKIPVPWSNVPLEVKGCFGDACPNKEGSTPTPKPPTPKKKTPKKEPVEKGSKKAGKK